MLWKGILCLLLMIQLTRASTIIPIPAFIKEIVQTIPADASCQMSNFIPPTSAIVFYVLAAALIFGRRHSNNFLLEFNAVSTLICSTPVLCYCASFVCTSQSRKCLADNIESFGHVVLLLAQISLSVPVLLKFNVRPPVPYACLCFSVALLIMSSYCCVVSITVTDATEKSLACMLSYASNALSAQSSAYSEFYKACLSQNIVVTHQNDNVIYDIVRTLGEGAFGEVKLVSNRINPNLALAVKCVNMSLHSDRILELRREGFIQNHCCTGSHPNILKYFTMKYDLKVNHFYIVVEYAAGGEVLDQIVPGVGLPSKKAKSYFRQLMSGLAHMHRIGVAHRDIKPENLLLTKEDVLKIADFGMAAIFSDGTFERKLNSSCGTTPYVAPEVLNGNWYSARPVDVWSAGVVLVTFLAGELPWESPALKNWNFADWRFRGRYTWKKMEKEAHELVRAILECDPAIRITIDKIQEHRWVTSDSEPHANSSQAQDIDDIILKTPIGDALQDPLYMLAPRMTRFCVLVAMDEAIQRLKSACKEERYTVDGNSPNQFIVKYDKMAFMVSFLDMNEGGLQRNRVIVDFRRSRGDGLEFKRAFINLKNQLGDIICSAGNQWLATQGLTPEPLEEDVY